MVDAANLNQIRTEPRNQLVTSARLARFLRTGPARPMLDRLVRVAANAAGVESMVLGLRHGNVYEFIATHGIPLTAYTDRVPGKVLGPKLFSREVEVPDLQAEPQFTALSVSAIAKSWRYGVNVPVQLVASLTDGGVLALSGADSKPRALGGKALAEMRRIAEVIADSVWLIQQIQKANASGKPTHDIARIMLDGIGNSPLAAAVIDSDLKMVGFSRSFALAQKAWLGSTPKIGQRLDTSWFDSSASEAVRSSFETIRPAFGVPTTPPQTFRTMHFDFHSMLFNDDQPSKFGVIGLHIDPENNRVHAPMLPPLTPLSSLAAGDGTQPVTRFLDDTLQKRRRLLRRKTQSYLALRTWRKSIKPYQVAALKALKSDCPASIVDLVAKEMAEEITSFFGQVSGHVVVPVPCGHSGPGCLSSRLAQAVARNLAIECIAAFDCVIHNGASHPKKNVTRPKMRLAQFVDAPIILIDDVATSGAHIEEAGQKLLATAPSVWSVVWIAD